jgi:hypothetical protein
VKLRLLGTLVVAIAAAAVVAASPLHAQPVDSKQILLNWYDLTAQAVTAAAVPEQSTQEHIWAVAWLAAARATAANDDPRYADAALVTALHDTLASLVPADAARLDSELANSLAQIPDGKQKQRGIDAGHAQAAATLAERAGDGFDTASVDRPWTPPPAAPGVYQLTGGPAVRAGLPDATPFVIKDKNQFDPGLPPALDSARYLTDLAEVHALGSVNSTERTPEQTDVARFWAQSSLLTYTQILREIIATDPRPTPTDARIVAAFHAIELDQQIAVHAAKYRYLFWRPVTAIRTGPVDPDPNWTPLIATPRHPEYPSGHAAFGGTAEVVLAALAPSDANDTFSAASTTDGGVTHTWTGWKAITQETINARVWEGVHFRFSDEVGAQLGREVAAYDLAHLDAIGL